jgi:GH18 family chitinase
MRLTVAFGGGDRSDAFPAMATDPGKRQLFVMDLTQFLLKHGFDGVDYDWEFPSGVAQKQALTNLVVETKSAFEPYGLTVTIATAPWDEFDPRVYAAVDRLHLMSYFDDSRHASLSNAVSDVDALIDKGAPPGKICLGIPFYAMKLHGEDAGLSYADVEARFHPAAGQDEVDDYAFDGPHTIERKRDFAGQRGLAGIMIWELGQDTPDGLLVKAITAAGAQ